MPCPCGEAEDGRRAPNPPPHVRSYEQYHRITGRHAEFEMTHCVIPCTSSCSTKTMAVPSPQHLFGEAHKPSCHPPIQRHSDDRALPEALNPPGVDAPFDPAQPQPQPRLRTRELKPKTQTPKKTGDLMTHVRGTPYSSSLRHDYPSGSTCWLIFRSNSPNVNKSP